MKRTRLFSPEMSQKITWYGSVAFMILAWLFLATLWVSVIVRAWLDSDFGWTLGGYIMMAVYLFVLVMIPVQLKRYVREKKRR